MSAAKTNARRLVVAVKDAVAAEGRQTHVKKSYKYKFSFFFSDRNSSKKDLELYKILYFGE